MRPFDECLVRSVASLRPAVETLEAQGLEGLSLGAAVERGYFVPNEEEVLVSWFARLLTVRGSLWEIIDDASGVIDDDLDRVVDRETWRCFLAGYAAACLVVRIDRCVVEQIATHSLVQRKLNEGWPEHRVPRKQFTKIFRSLADPRGALRLLRAMRFIDRQREFVASMGSDEVVGPLVSDLHDLETALDPSKRRFLDLLRSFEVHATRRRGASARQRSVEATLERSGRTASELRLRREKRVLAELDEFRSILAPGDVLVTRHEGALTNLFLPGFWPHAALYVGTPEDRRAIGLPKDSIAGREITPEQTVLEALKDGVLFRPLDSTLAVDAVAVLRPHLSKENIARALERAAVHEGKLYNFDFDFFRSDRLVCTEVVYRAFDGLDSVSFDLTDRAGRPTLSAEDLIRYALAERHLDVVAAFGIPGALQGLELGDEARRLVAKSL